MIGEAKEEISNQLTCSQLYPEANETQAWCVALGGAGI